MTSVPLESLLAGAGVLRFVGEAQTPIQDLAADSRVVKAGDLFFALPGAKTDGARFIKDAVRAGAAAVVSALEPPPAPAVPPAAWVQVQDPAAAMGRMADRFFAHPSRAMTVVGVTGTNGKTTTTYFLESIFARCGGVCAVVGTVECRLAGRTFAPAVNTTPISLELLRLLARFRDGGATHAALEVSSHALSLKRVEEVEFDAAVFTNLGRDHLDFHKTPEAYFQAKARLFELLNRASSSKKRKVAAYNADDPKAAALKRLSSGAVAVPFGLGPAAELRAEGVSSGLDGSTFELRWRGRRRRARLRLPAAHNVHNALAAAAAALGLGLPLEKVLEGLEGLASVPGRLEPVEEGQSFKVFVDYAHTEQALAAVLAALARAPHRRLITVFGCGGERDRGKRAPMGRAAGLASDLVFATSDNPRGEDPGEILSAVEEGLKTTGKKNYKILEDRGAAIAEAVGSAGPGDIVLIAGKGHERNQILKDGTFPFDDREAARAALRGRR